MRNTINLDCKTHHISNDGTFPILLRVSLNGKHDYFNTGNRIQAIHYDSKNKVVKKGIKGATNYSSLIDIHKIRIRNIIAEYDTKGEIISISRLKDIYNLRNGSVKESTCFIAYLEKRITWEKQYANLKIGTQKTLDVQFNKLKTYKKTISFYDIDEKFLYEYKSYISKKLNQSNNTIYHAMSFVRKYIKLLNKEGKLSKNPFDNYIVGSPFESKLVYLDLEELRCLHNLYESNKLLEIKNEKKNKYSKSFNIGEKYQSVLQYFLVSCYTGFRHSDIKTLQQKHLIGNTIVKTLIKGREGRQPTVNIPIEDNYGSLLSRNNPDGLLFDNPVMETSQTNKYLKEIMEIAKIDKHVTFHKARYTFAINSLILGMSLSSVSEILGHSELETTQRYAKVVDTLLKQDMHKWSGIRKDDYSSSNISIVCANCDNVLISIFGKAVIIQQKIQCTCPNCNVTSFYEIQI